MIHLPKKQTLLAISYGLSATALLFFSIFIGSRGFKNFDHELTYYALGSLLATFAIAYRLSLWSQRPPTRTYLIRGMQILLGKLKRKPNFSKIQKTPVRRSSFKVLATHWIKNFAFQLFVRKRNTYRWIMHLCLSGGCTLAFAITFPLVFGWVHFDTSPQNAEIYVTQVFGFSIDQFNVHSIKGFFYFNLLNIAALFVLIGLIMAGIRRCTNAGERATQTFAEDILPLILIFAVTATGLLLTVSYKFLEGSGHATIALVHLGSVILLLLYIPYGKLFHMFQRNLALLVALYKKEATESEQAHCHCCGAAYASSMQISDLKTVLNQLHFQYQLDDNSNHYQDICPPCRRKIVSVSQGQSIGR